MNIRILPIALTCIVLFSSACQTTSETGEPVEELVEQPAEVATPTPVSMENGIKGTVHFLELEGGFYGITTEDGKNYLPLNLDEAFKQDSLQVMFTMKPRRDVVTIAMWGQPVDITAIERVEE